MTLSVSVMACSKDENGYKTNNDTEVNNDQHIDETNPGDGNTAEDVVIEETRSLEEIMDAIYSETGIEDFPATMKAALTSENLKYMLGLDTLDYVEGLTSEPMMSSIAHSIVLVELTEGADFEQIMSSVKENVDGRKWICVGVEEENIRVEHVGDYMLLVMDHQAQSFVDAFHAVMQ